MIGSKSYIHPGILYDPFTPVPSKQKCHFDVAVNESEPGSSPIASDSSGCNWKT